jgi:hypothetical protein
LKEKKHIQIRYTMSELNITGMFDSEYGANKTNADEENKLQSSLLSPNTI